MATNLRGLPPLVSQPVPAPPRPYRRLQEELGGLFDNTRRQAAGLQPLSPKVLDFIKFTEGEADSIYGQINKISNLLDWIWYLLRQYVDGGLSQEELLLLKRYIRRLFENFKDQMDEHDVRKAMAIKAYLEGIVPPNSPPPLGDDGLPLPPPLTIDPNDPNALSGTQTYDPDMTPWRWGYQDPGNPQQATAFNPDPLLPGLKKFIPGTGEVVPPNSMYRPYIQESPAGSSRQLLFHDTMPRNAVDPIAQSVGNHLNARRAARQALTGGSKGGKKGVRKTRGKKGITRKGKKLKKVKKTRR